MNLENIDNLIAEIFASVLLIAVQPGEYINRKSEPKWDSLKHMEIIFAVESAFDIRIHENDIGDIVDTTTLRDRIMRCVA